MRGAFQPRHARQMMWEAVVFAQRHGALNLLVDSREMKPTQGLLLEMIGLPGIAAELGFPQSGQAAVVHQPCPQKPEVFRVLESLYRNASVSVRFFSDLERASNWIDLSRQVHCGV